VTHILSCDSDEIEVVISNNASTDATLEMLSRIDDKRLRIFSNTENIGALNWPLVVSKAGGQWAALMSDEDIVCLENLPYFLELLRKADSDDVGAIIYCFPPITFIGGEYVCQNQLDSFKQASKYGRHLTCHILNMRYFVLDDLNGYKGFGSLVGDALYISDPPVAEPQWEILLRMAVAHKVMLTGVSLCSFGKDETVDKQPVLESSKLQMGSESLRRVEIQTDAMIHKLGQISNLSRHGGHGNYDINMFAVIIRLLMYITTRAASYINRIVLGVDFYRPEIFKILQRESNFTRDDAVRYACDYSRRYLDVLSQLTDDNDNFPGIGELLRAALTGNVRAPLMTRMPEFERILIGNYLFESYCTANRILYCKDNDNSKRFFKFLEDFDDVLELRKTDLMFRALRDDNEYDSVINMPGVTTFRKHYPRGEAYLAKKEYDRAIDEFEQFLNVVENPNCIADIMTEEISVQASYYYLGYACQKTGNLHKSVRYYSRCHELTEALLLGDSLVPLRLKYAE
jgi:hypothetical protein